jgi:hypothetical protein
MRLMMLVRAIRFDRYSYTEMTNSAYLGAIQPLVSVAGGALSGKE